MAALSDIVLDLRSSRGLSSQFAPQPVPPRHWPGDAIAVTLMKMKGLSEQDCAPPSRRPFPGGYCSPSTTSCAKVPTTSSFLFIKASRRCWPKSRASGGAISIVNERNELVGLVSDYDIRKALESEHDIFFLKITGIMNPILPSSSPPKKPSAPRDHARPQQPTAISRRRQQTRDRQGSTSTI